MHDDIDDLLKEDHKNNPHLWELTTIGKPFVKDEGQDGIMYFDATYVRIEPYKYIVVNLEIPKK